MAAKKPEAKKPEAKKIATKKPDKAKFDRGNPIILITNEVPELVSNANVEALIAGLQAQIDQDFFPYWGLRARLAFSMPVDVPHMELDITGGSDQQGDLGYHFRADGYPQAYIFATEAMAGGAGIKGLSTTLSHEILEMIADPGVNLSAAQPPKKSRGETRLFAYEVCDPVEANYYKKNGVWVCDFVLPEWFEHEHQPGEMKMDFFKAVDAPFQIAPNGYADVFEGGKWVTRWGKEATTNGKKKGARGRHRFEVRTSRTRA